VLDSVFAARRWVAKWALLPREFAAGEAEAFIALLKKHHFHVEMKQVFMS
jgi:hypothetical protein